MTKTFTVTPKSKQQEMNKKYGELFKSRKKIPLEFCIYLLSVTMSLKAAPALLFNAKDFRALFAHFFLLGIVGWD